MKSLFFLITVISLSAISGKAPHRHQDAHVHGAASLNIALDSLDGEVEFKTASDSLLGFEHKAKTEFEQKKLKNLIAKFEAEISKMIIFDPSTGCSFSKEKIGMTTQGPDHNENHSDFVADFKIRCKKTVIGTKLIIDFTSFKGLRDLDIIVLAGDIQKSAEAKQKVITIDLK